MSESQNEGAFAPPPVDFRLFVQGFAMQAFMALGKIPHPETGEQKVELGMARYFIDVLGMIEEKTQGNLNKEEQAFLDNQLENLRLNFVDVQKTIDVEKTEGGGESGEDASQ
ncbi:MAG: hypothetical protein CSA62_13950 [Planctomycetota bacterium]|nr:MAG: hypothetical protein CSA62_13950 [Planctomycetota bacterium]